LANSGGRNFGFVVGGSVPASMAAAWLVCVWDQNAGMRVQSPVAAALEDTAIEWVRQLLGLPEGTGGGLVTVATMANFASLAAARHALLERAGWDVENEGLFGAPPITVVIGEEVHSSVLKALGMIGFGRNRVVRVPVDSQGRMRADALPHLDDRTILCLQAGNVNTGAFDPAAAICPAARAAGAWIHVDGAFGLWAAASPEYRKYTKGFDQADSWATDAHKWPNIGYDCGVALIRDPKTLRAAMSIEAAYLVHGEQREPSHYNPRSGIVGRPSLVGPIGHRRDRREDLNPRSQVRRRAQGCGIPDPERCCHQPSARLVWNPRKDPENSRASAAGRNLLVRFDRMARPNCHAHQRFILGDHKN
jgi:glutamate/tyrosine decarboxylase-like PLP-dependent enzyme